MAPLQLFAETGSIAEQTILVTARHAELAIEVCGPSKTARTTWSGAVIPELVARGGSPPVRYTNPILRHLARTAECGLLGKKFIDEAEIDGWLDWAALEVDHTLKLPGAPIEPLCNVLEAQLKSQTFLVGERLTLADIAVAVPMKAAVEAKGVSEVKSAYPALTRWLFTCTHNLSLPESKPGAKTDAPVKPQAQKAKSKTDGKVDAKTVSASTAPTATEGTAPSATKGRIKTAPMKLFVEAGSPAAKTLLAAAKFAGLSIEIAGAAKSSSPCGFPIPELVFGNSKPVRHTMAILRHIAQVVECGLTGSSFSEEAQIDAWLDWTALEVTHSMAVPNFSPDPLCQVLEAHLKNRTFIIGQSGLTIADIALAVPLKTALEAKGMSEVKAKYPSTVRWLLTCVHQLELD